MNHYECPMNGSANAFCFHREAFTPGPAPDEDTPASSDLAYDAMVTHLGDVPGITGPEAGYLVHQAHRKAVAA